MLPKIAIAVLAAFAARRVSARRAAEPAHAATPAGGHPAHHTTAADAGAHAGTEAAHAVHGNAHDHGQYETTFSVLPGRLQMDGRGRGHGMFRFPARHKRFVAPVYQPPPDDGQYAPPPPPPPPPDDGSDQ